MTRLPVSRAPNGMVRARVNMPLTLAERDDLLALAKQESRSAGSMARLIYLRGLAAYRAEIQLKGKGRVAGPGNEHHG